VVNDARPVALQVDWTTDIDAVRKELARVLATEGRGCGRKANVQVVDSSERTMQLRVLVRGHVDSIFDLRCGSASSPSCGGRRRGFPSRGVEQDGVPRVRRPEAPRGGRARVGSGPVCRADPPRLPRPPRRRGRIPSGMHGLRGGRRLARDVKGNRDMKPSPHTNAVVQALVACRARRELKGTERDTPEERQAMKAELWAASTPGSPRGTRVPRRWRSGRSTC
jgi:hypothetical protein